MSAFTGCCVWGCEAEGDWRDPAHATPLFCRVHAQPEHFWPVSEWAYASIRGEGGDKE